VLSLVLYEPVLFGAVIADSRESAAAREILALRDDTIRLVDQGNLNLAAQRFVDYWTGEGTWLATPEPRRRALAEAMRAVKSQWHALLDEPTPLSGFEALDVPTLFMTGTESKASALAVTRLVTAVLPRVRREELEGMGHMGPVTHPGTVNPLIRRFLEAPNERGQFPLRGCGPSGQKRMDQLSKGKPLE
jgi:pimeloyl-ACP methyl ester carboxylesterase